MVFIINYGIPLYSKSLPSESALRNAERCKGGELWAPEKTKKSFFLDFEGPITCPPYIFHYFGGYFYKANFSNTIESRNVNNEKNIFWGVN